ncbi:hypothetical protein SLA2020_516380 [Shorea laevis]
MWMHNVAAAMMMMNVATGILQRMPVGPSQSNVVCNFCKAVVLGVIYAAAVEGMRAPVVCLISATITEFTSNNATTTLLTRLLIQNAQTIHVPPLLLMAPVDIGAQFAFLLPTGTPSTSNIVGFRVGHIEISDMTKTGLPPKIAETALISFLMPTLVTIF